MEERVSLVLWPDPVGQSMHGIVFRWERMGYGRVTESETSSLPDGLFWTCVSDSCKWCR